MAEGHFLRSLPGRIATVLAIVVTTLWLYVGAGSMYYEAWGQPFPRPLAHLVPGLASLALCLVAFQWPRLGGMLLFASGVVFSVYWWSSEKAMPPSPLQVVLMLLFILGLPITVGCLFLLDARHRRLLREAGLGPPQRWIARNVRSLFLVGVPLAALVSLSVQKLPEVLSRRDDGLRGARLIEGNGVTLVWAPQGPGWNGQLPSGEYPSWNMLALYGTPPLGLVEKDWSSLPPARAADLERTCVCAYLDTDGVTLLPEPAFIWRLPTPDEALRSLTHDGENAGCSWDGRSPHAVCREPTNKETPLWAPDERPIYYWTAAEQDRENALGVNYQAGVTPLPKSRTSGSIGYRCVRDVKPPSGGS